MPRAKREKITWLLLQKKIDFLMKSGYDETVLNACLHKHDIKRGDKDGSSRRNRG